MEMVSNQGGDAAVIDNQDLLPRASKQIEILAPSDGIVASLDALSIGRAANLLGAGRFTKNDTIDPAVGIEVVCKVSEHASKRETLAILHVNNEANLEQAKAMVSQAYTIRSESPLITPLIIERVSGD